MHGLYVGHRFLGMWIDLFRKLKLELPYCSPSILFVGPIYIEHISTYGKMMYIHNMVIFIDGPVRVSRNTEYHYDMILFESCHLITNGPIAISHNTAFGKNIMSLRLCSAVFKGLITISDNYHTDSIMLFEISDITFESKTMFVSNSCNKIIGIISEYKEYPYIKVMQHANVTFFDNE